MSLARFSSDYLLESFTLVDNLFINEHLPYCDEKQIKVYLYGLYLCMSPQKENTIEKLSCVLDVELSELLAVFDFFEDAGLCQVISRTPLEVKYLSLKSSMQPPKKYKAEKWSDFNTHLQQLFPERMITPNEYNEYYTLIDWSKIQQDALLMIVQYCINLKGMNVRYPYIMAVAKNWISDGVMTVADVENKLQDYESQTEQMRELLQILGRKGKAELEDKQLLLKWTKSWGYEFDAVLFAAKALRGAKTFKKLDTRLDEFYRMSIFTKESMSNYQDYRDKLFNLAISINKVVGVYYESLDHVIEYYIQPWNAKGFSDEALHKIAHQCFVSNIRTLDGMNSLVDKFYTKGLLSVESIDEFVKIQVYQDKLIKESIKQTDRSRNVTNSDRQYYRTWNAIWGFTHEMILFVSKLASSKTYPTSYINQLLSQYKTNGIKTIAEAEKFNKKQTSPKTINQTQAVADFEQREYTPEELQSVITSIESLKDSDL